ncbi:hypothetical protein CNR22_01400 [Sphingobacteriaceae bacterium]|nr:hypothetical protein CNR22_01400 [Sphingobacteriaceae bacterium]
MFLTRTLSSKALMTTEMVADKLVELCRQNKRADAIDELYSDKITSIVLKGESSEQVEGKLAVSRKIYELNSSTEQIRDLYISDPIVSGDYFSFTMETDSFMKGIGRVRMNEVCVYKVQYGKIVFEQFFFTAQ